MKYETQRAILASWPLAMATLVVAGLPWQGELSAREASRALNAVASPDVVQTCRARHPARPELMRDSDAGARSQSPAWMRRHAAEVERCLREGLPTAR